MGQVLLLLLLLVLHFSSSFLLLLLLLVLLLLKDFVLARAASFESLRFCGWVLLLSPSCLLPAPVDSAATHARAMEGERGGVFLHIVAAVTAAAKLTPEAALWVGV